MEEVKMEDVRAEAAVAVASTLVDKVHQERKSNAAKIVKYPPPPPFIRAVLLVQAFVRRRAFLRSFGGVGAGDNVDEEILELAPAKPMMSIALNFVRRLKSFRWVNIEREATLVAGLVDAQAANITMRDVSAVVNYYQDKVPSDHLSLNVLQEALDRQVIVAKEALQERASKLTSPAAIVEAMEQVITDFQVPPEREDRVLDQTRIRLKRIVAVAEAEETIRKMLAESSSTPSIDAVAARFKRDFGPVASVVEEELKVARIRRVQFLEMELETRWSRPFAGPLPPHSRAARRYELELGKKNPKVIAFVTEEARHAATLEADFEVELSDLRAKVRDLTQKRMEARARSLIQDFDEKLADAAAQVQEVIDRAILNIGPENPKVIKRAKELLSPDAHSTLFALQAEHTADQLRAELAVADPSPEAGDRRRGCAMALAALLGQLNRDHPLQAKLRAEFAQDLSEIAGTGAAREARDETAPPLPPPDEGPGEVTPPPVTDTEKPGAGESEGPTGPTDLELAIQMDEDPFKLEPTPEETNQALFEAGVRQYDDDPNLDLPDEEQDLWGAPKGFSELTSINHEVLDSTRKADFEDDKAKLSFDPDPANVLLMSSIAAEDLSPEMRKKRFEQEKAERARGEQKERTAVLTLEELTMETVKLHTEEVFKLKFVRSIAEALQIPKHRVKVNGFERGSVKVLLSILEPTGEEDEEGRNTMSADRALQELAEQVEDPNSRLRLGEVGPFVVAAHLDRDVIKSDQVKVGSMADAYLASHLEGEDYELPGQAGSWTAESASVHDSDEADPDQLIKKAHATVGTRWGSSRMEHGSLQAESHFRSTCPHSKEDGTLAAWAIPYEKQPMYTFYEKNSEEAAKEPIIRLPEEKRKVTMTASFHLTRHPASGTDVLKGKIPPAGGVKAYAADTWLDKEHLGMKDPTLRPGDADLQETIKKKAAKAEPLAEFEEPATPAAGGLAGVGGAATVAVPRPTSAASEASRSEASDASESKKKKKGKKKGKEEQQSSTEQSASATLSAESSKMEAEASHAKTDSMTADAESEAGKKEKPKKKGKKKTGSGEGAEEMGQTGESFHSMASATSAASQASALTDESEADSPKAKKKPKAKPSAKKEAQPSKLEIPKEGGETGSRKGSDVTTSDTEVVVPKAGGSSPKPTDSGRRPSPKKDRSRSPKPEGPDLGGKEVQNLEGLGANFATQFCWAGMYGGMSGTGLRPRWKDNPRLPALVGKQSTDDLHTPCYVRHAYRVGTVAVGPPYQLREKMDAMSPAWSALRVLDLSIEKADWVRSYSKILKEHSRKLGPAQGIREMNRTVSLPKVGASRPKPRPVLRARSAEAKKDRRTSPGKDTSVERRRETERLDVDSTRRIDVDPKRKDTKEDKKKKDKDKDKKKKEKKDKKGEEDEDGKKKKKDKKKKDKKDKHQSEAQEEEPEVEEPIEAPESFETMPSVGTWLMSFTEDMLLRPVSVESPTSVAESLYSATFGVEASVADALLSAAFGQLTPEAVEDLTDEIIAEQADQETEATTLEMARAAVHQTLQHAAIILAQQEASQSSNAICARAAVALAIQRAAEILSRKEDELPVLVPEEAPPSVETIIHIQPEEAVELVEPQAEVVESDGSEVETEPEVRFPVKRTPFTNSGATRREVSNFALSLTSSIFRASKLAPGQRHASRSRSPLPVAELSATVPPVPPARAQQEASFAASFVPPQRDPGRQSPPPRPPPTEPSPRPDRGPKPKLTAVPANEGERF